MTDLLIPQKYARLCGACKHLNMKITLHGDYHPCKQKDNEQEGTLCRIYATECQFFEQEHSPLPKIQAARQTEQALQSLTVEQLTLTLTLGEP